MTKTYEEIISVIRGDIEKLEREIVKDLTFPTSDLNNLLLAKAKRIRSALAFLFLRANGISVSYKHLNFQAAIELAHSASLMHDDVIDKSDKRRGLDTLNTQFGDKIGVLAGDYLLSNALKRILDKPSDLVEFLKTFSNMAQGEISQYFTHFKIPTLENYLDKTTKKTAGLFRLALLDIAPEFGLNFGIAFQIKNDLKDIEIDVKNGVYTAPVIFSQNPDAITTIAIKQTKDLINDYLIKAQNHLQNLPQNIYSQALIELVELYKE